MNLNRNRKIARLPDCLGQDGRWLVEDRPAVGAEPPARAGKRCAASCDHARSNSSDRRWGVAATPVRARPQALKLDFIPCRHTTQSTTTNGHSITFSQAIAMSATLACCCGRGRPISGAFLSRRRSADVRCQTVSNRVKPLFPKPSSEFVEIRAIRVKAFASSDFGFRISDFKSVSPVVKNFLQISEISVSQPLYIMTHTGKIGRLPKSLRDQLGHRLEDGLAGPEILAWLNQLPEVQQILDDHFDGRPITEQNLSDWRQAGHLEWIRREEARQAIVGLAEQADDVNDLVGGRHLVDEFALVVVAEIHRLSRLLLSDEVDLEKRWKRLREINRELGQLRKQDHEASKLRLAEERCALDVLKEQKNELRARQFGVDAALRQRIQVKIQANQAAWDEQMASLQRRLDAALVRRPAPVSEPAGEPEPELAPTPDCDTDPDSDSAPEIPPAEQEAEQEETKLPPPSSSGNRAKKSTQSPRIQVNRGKSRL